MAEASAKPNRAEEVKRERRRKPGSMVAGGIKLGLDKSKLDLANYVYRYVRDEGNRVAQMVAQDYDPVVQQVKDDTNSIGTLNTAHGGVLDGKPYNMVLMSKPRDWFEADQLEKQKPLDAIEAAIKRGNPNHAGNDLKGPGVYTPGADASNPAGVNSIERA